MLGGGDGRFKAECSRRLSSSNDFMDDILPCSPCLEMQHLRGGQLARRRRIGSSAAATSPKSAQGSSGVSAARSVSARWRWVRWRQPWQ
mmetsp:Transcript_18046/g.45314  ORF Transcript_18046/g.45314 Transcript_18046/m.45314 type:complete len:89 (-) Transcript_18046:501-767(-)